MTIQNLADTLRAQAAKLDGNYGTHVHGMRAGLLLAAVQAQHLANNTTTQADCDYQIEDAA